jgi:hypothetical protein
MSLYNLCYWHMQLLWALWSGGTPVPVARADVEAEQNYIRMEQSSEPTESQEKSDKNQVVWDDPTVWRGPLQWRH